MFVAKQDPIMNGYDIVDVDVEGVGSMVAAVRVPMMANDKTTGDKLARLICLSLNLEGGIDRALEFLRAETVRQKA